MKEKEEKRKFPVLVNWRRENWLRDRAQTFVHNFEKVVYPVISRFGLFDDEHIRKYLECTTMEPIYRDFADNNPERVRQLEADAAFWGSDPWTNIRDIRSKVQTPRDPKFIFAKFPAPEGDDRQTVLNSLSVKDGKISIDLSLLENASIVHPTERQRLLYDIVADFCDALQENGFERKEINQLCLNVNKRIVPNLPGIVSRFYCSVKSN